MSIVMGLDQHRGQVTGEWIDTDTGEVQRTRVAPADRAAVRRFVERFGGRELEVAKQLIAGNGHPCVLLQDATVSCWGADVVTATTGAGAGRGAAAGCGVI